MITAVPISHDRIAGHFTKADSFIFINGEGRVVCHHINPARESGCAGKKALLNLLGKQKTERVITRNIGERMLGKLLDRNLAVFQIDHSQLDTQILGASENLPLTALTDSSQGRRSVNYETKKESGGCGCHHGEEHETGEKTEGCHQHGGKRCCQH
ncbi:hypothetical protein I2492_10480 [Budviciaceae bacterium CWB-B4]|uniref:Dinitrogenase iron-molybdenum cofactor biosynthesis domain-containing protein n=1 Tax=Limnobaculum xujianqingii TaxID=2738837 RepID=A0A9D7FTU5_9GAMM|nr:NifB/NifX family molybdenum-iron cluster-binding protein [Limnobaculum xujianqingii]MBK5073522.1 hypothetical protein [Limnobaculum xujianqingii]MBK5176747.1 hypothetical protein [Limnobaculum xujianqingii]